jgi:hypothetical protein
MYYAAVVRCCAIVRRMRDPHGIKELPVPRMQSEAREIYRREEERAKYQITCATHGSLAAKQY